MKHLEKPVTVCLCGDYLEFSNTHTVAECKKLKAKYVVWDDVSGMSIYELVESDWSAIPDPNNFLIVTDPFCSCSARPDTRSIWHR